MADRSPPPNLKRFKSSHSSQVTQTPLPLNVIIKFCDEELRASSANLIKTNFFRSIFTSQTWRESTARVVDLSNFATTMDCIKLAVNFLNNDRLTVTCSNVTILIDTIFLADYLSCGPDFEKALLQLLSQSLTPQGVVPSLLRSAERDYFRMNKWESINKIIYPYLQIKFSQILPLSIHYPQLDWLFNIKPVALSEDKTFEFLSKIQDMERRASLVKAFPLQNLKSDTLSIEAYEILVSLGEKELWEKAVISKAHRKRTGKYPLECPKRDRFQKHVFQGPTLIDNFPVLCALDAMDLAEPRKFHLLASQYPNSNKINMSTYSSATCDAVSSSPTLVSIFKTQSKKAKIIAIKTVVNNALHAPFTPERQDYCPSSTSLVILCSEANEISVFEIPEDNTTFSLRNGLNFKSFNLNYNITGVTLIGARNFLLLEGSPLTDDFITQVDAFEIWKME